MATFRPKSNIIVLLYESASDSIKFSNYAKVEIGDSYFEMKEYENARKVYNDLPNELRNELATLYNLGIISVHLEELEKAEMYFNLFLETEKKDPGVYYYLGLVFLKQYKMDEAYKFLLKSYNLNSNSPHIFLILAEYWFKNGEKEKAKENYKKATSLAPKVQTKKNDKLYL